MESTINRKDYRRNSCDSYERIEREKNVPKTKSNIFMNQIIDSMLLLLMVLLFKFFNLDSAFEHIKNNFSSGIPYETLKEESIQKFNSILNSFLGDDGITIIGSGDMNNDALIEVENGEIENTSGDNSGDYIEAVEGINQLSEDADKIKEIYEISSPLNGIITSEFGCRNSDNPKVSSYHAGLDIAANAGTNIISAHDGKVTLAGENGTYGKCVIIENGDLKTVYAHCSSVLVKVGDNIKKGENIAKVGMTGNATGPHLHFEIRYQGRFVNPADVI